jgi:hypothetical protein
MVESVRLSIADVAAGRAFAPSRKSEQRSSRPEEDVSP